MAVGKTHLANHLQGYLKFAFANKLKAIVYDLYGLQGKDGRVREVLQGVGDDLRKYDPNVWINHLLRQCKSSLDSPPFWSPPFQGNIVVDDVRYPNEADALRKNGFTIILVTCDEKVRQERIKTLYPNMSADAHLHVSETASNNIRHDDFVDTTVTLDGLAKLDEIIERLSKQKVGK